MNSNESALRSDDGRRWWSHIQVLADDQLEGRRTGTEGHAKAARYIAEQLAARP